MKFLNNIKIAVKLPVFVVLVGLITLASTITIAYLQSAEQLKYETQEKLLALETTRAMTIKDYLETIQEDLIVFSDNPTTIEAAVAFEEAFEMIDGNAMQELQDQYIHNNPHPAGEKHLLDYAPQDTIYNMTHKEYHNFFRSLQQNRGYYDVFLVAEDGNLVYSVFKDLDYATNLLNGEYKDTGIATVFKEVLTKKDKDYIAFDDFKPYAPSYGAPASFIAKALYDDGDFIGVLIFQMPVDKINRVMNVSEGMGETGETYLVGEDHLMRSNSRFSDESTILKQKIDTKSVEEALSGKKGTMVITDYRGVEVLSAYSSINFLGATYAVIAEMDINEIMLPVIELKNKLLGISFVILIFIVITAVAFSILITRPIARITEVMKVLSSGKLDVDIPAKDNKDEIGDMARSVEVFKDNAIRAKELEEEQAKAEERAAAEKRAAMNKMADEFEASVMGVVETVTSAATELNSTATSMSSIAEETSKQSMVVSSAAEQASANVQTVASAAAELSTSINEIAGQVSEASRISTEAVQEVEATTQVVSGLSDASQKISDVVSLITDIAEKTNLLALNATIEAARAGDAGKGFAVVAGEVKSLANQTAKATEEISKQIGSVQGSTKDAVEAIKRIGGVINKIDEISSGIASAVEEQGAATQEISRNVEQAATGTSEVSSSIGPVNEASNEAGSAATQVASASNELSQNATTLKEKVTEFIQSIRES